MNHLRVVLCAVPVLGIPLAMSGCRAVNGASGDSPDAQRTTIQDERAAAMGELYAAHPETRERARNAAGYGYFGNVNVNIILLSTENGYGVVHDNATGRDTYMKMASAGVGLGMGVKDYRVVIIFTDPAVMNRFVTSGWDFGGQVDAAAKADNTGAATGGAATAQSVAGMEIYQFTKTGVALQATLQGTKYWPDSTLNK